MLSHFTQFTFENCLCQQDASPNKLSTSWLLSEPNIFHEPRSLNITGGVLLTLVPLTWFLITRVPKSPPNILILV